MELSTCHVAKHRKVDKETTVFIDTTVKSGVQFLAPSWEMVMGHKAGTLSNEAYTDLFLKRMERSLKRFPYEWGVLLSHPSVCLACYCPSGCFCHRLLLVSFIKSLCLERGEPFIYRGEIL